MALRSDKNKAKCFVSFQIISWLFYSELLVDFNCDNVIQQQN